jgi:hypothetical protein
MNSLVSIQFNVLTRISIFSESLDQMKRKHMSTGNSTVFPCNVWQIQMTLKKIVILLTLPKNLTF